MEWTKRSLVGCLRTANDQSELSYLQLPRAWCQITSALRSTLSSRYFLQAEFLGQSTWALIFYFFVYFTGTFCHWWLGNNLGTASEVQRTCYFHLSLIKVTGGLKYTIKMKTIFSLTILPSLILPSTHTLQNAKLVLPAQ